jgi:hypothetical protein
MKNLQPPQLLNDLYRDLRDRRMLYPVIALIVAIIAVPMLLGGTEEPVAPPAPVVASDDGTAVESAVLVGEPGIRNYSERLAALKSKNPFEQKFQLPETADSAGAEIVDGGAAATDSGAAPVATEDPAASSSGAAPAGDPEMAPADPGTSTEPVETEPAPPEIRFYAGRVDVAIGPLGKGKTYEDVRYLNFLPDDKAPLVAFIGLAEGGDRAIFSISSEVDMGKGDGSCAPKKPDPCQFLTMRIGDERYMKYGLEGKPYRLKLLDTEVVRIPDPRKPDGE